MNSLLFLALQWNNGFKVQILAVVFNLRGCIHIEWTLWTRDPVPLLHCGAQRRIWTALDYAEQSCHVWCLLANHLVWMSLTPDPLCCAPTAWAFLQMQNALLGWKWLIKSDNGEFFGPFLVSTVCCEVYHQTKSANNFTFVKCCIMFFFVFFFNKFPIKRLFLHYLLMHN